MKRSIILALPVILFIYSVFYPVQGMQIYSSIVPSHGVISIPSTSTLRVEGNKIVDSSNNEIRVKGFHLWDTDIFGDWNLPLTVDELSRIKSWGFNLVRGLIWWGAHLEPYEDQIGVYNEENLNKLEQLIINAREADLYFIISMRVSYNDEDHPSWWGWPKHNYLLTEEGLNRFCALWEMLVQRFDNYDNVFYTPWQFPWHQTEYDSSVVEYYNTVITPRLIESIRKYSEKTIFWSPIDMGAGHDENYDFYETFHYRDLQPLEDSNIVYSFESYMPFEVSHEGEPWNYDTESLESHFQFAIDFAERYTVPLIVGEFGINWQDYPGDQTHLDYLDAELEFFENSGINWLYWMYTKNSGFGVLNENGTPTEVVEILRQYTST